MFREWYDKIREKYEQKRKEADTLEKIVNTNHRKMEKIALKDKVNNAHINVLQNYRDCGIKVNPLKLFILEQEDLKKIDLVNKLELGLPFNPDNYIRGMHCPRENIILVDKLAVKYGEPLGIEHIIAHEYGHNLSYRLFSKIHLNRTYGKNGKKLELPPHEFSLKDKVNKKDTKLKINITTERKKRELEFENYFEEMFADSIALYVNRIIDGDIRFFSYSNLNKGDFLSKDKQFIQHLEERLYKIFYDDLFTNGLRKTVAMLPFVYSSAKVAFENRYREKLPEHKIAL